MTVECLRCGREVESRYEGDRRECQCRALEVDGQNVAVRVGWEVKNHRDWYRVLKSK